ncbi:hypothetical protein HOD29_02335 [archaeon]|jgi:hypothetical protein|nr:hypothetical protein [archaeon]
MAKENDYMKWMDEGYKNLNSDEQMERIRNYFSPILNYFELKKKLDKDDLKPEMKSKLENLLKKMELDTKDSVDEIMRVFKGEDKSNWINNS